MNQSRASAIAKYQKTPRGKYIRQKVEARRRGIAFTITFEQWQAIWRASGKWSKRGNRPGCYVMCRYGDVGPYSAANVYIGTFRRNLREARSRVGVVRKHTSRYTQVTFI